MAEQKQGAYSDLRAEVKKSTPILIDKLPKDVQDALRRQMAYKVTTGEVLLKKGPSGATTPLAHRAPASLAITRVLQTDVPEGSNALDREIIARAGLQGRTILQGPPKNWTPG